MSNHSGASLPRGVIIAQLADGQSNMTNSYATLTIEQPQPGTTLVTLNRPEAANALNTQMALDLRAVFDGFAAEPNRWRCIIVTGAGDRAFCAGGDLKERNGMTDAQWQDQHLIFPSGPSALSSNARCR